MKLHFNKLKRLVSGISSIVLAGRLSEHEREGLVNIKQRSLSSPRELGKWVIKWKGAKSSPKLTSKM